jgi:glutathione S-transferase
LLELPHTKVDVNLGAGEHKSPGFLALNPFGQIPVLEDGERALADSNAILTYLARRYGGGRWTPATAELEAEQQRWFSVAAGPLASGPAAARTQRLFRRPGELEAKQAMAHALFRVMDAHLSRSDYLVGGALSLADIANYAYTARAPEGGILLDEYPALRAWLARIEATPRFIPMMETPV